jgi:hypothetical protein
MAKYHEPNDPHSGHHLERENVCGLQASPDCTGNLRGIGGTYKQKLTKEGKIISICNICAVFFQEELARRKQQV